MNFARELVLMLRARVRSGVNRVVEQKWFNVGLRTKMSALVIVGLVGLLSIFALLGISTARQTTEQVISERVMLSRISAATLNSTLLHMHTILDLLADQPVFKNPAAGLAAQQAELGKVDLFNQGVYIINPDGQVIVSNNAVDPGIDWGQVESVQAALHGEGFNLSVLDEPSQQPHSLALIAVPVRDLSGQTGSALVALLDLASADLFPNEQPFTLGASGVLDVIDAQGHVLLSTHPDRVMSNRDKETILNNLFTAGVPGVETCLGCYSSDTSEGGDEIIAFAPLSQIPWGVVIRQNVDEVFAPVQRLSLLTLVLEFATLLGALVLVWVTTNSVIKPVQSLTEAAQRIAQGDLTTPIGWKNGDWFSSHLQRRDEIGTLWDTFRTMRRQLKRSMDEIQALNRDLDTRVQERTQAARQAQLEAQAARDDLRAIIDALSDELVVVGVDDFEVLQANQAAQRNRAGVQEQTGQYCFEVSHCGQFCQPPNCECPIPKVVETGASVKVTHVHCRSGEVDPKYVDIVASPMRDASGRISRVVELSRDVTEEKRIKESLVRRNQQLSIINAVAITANQSLDLEDILGRALEEVLNLTEIDAGAVFLQEDALGQLNLMAYRGLSEDAARLASQMGMLDSSCGGIIEKGQIVIVPNLNKFRGKRARSLRREHLSTLVHIPLIAKGCTLGSMCVGTRQERQFPPDEQELLTAIGSQIAVAIENARLYAEVQHKEHIRGELFKKAISAQEEERKRIARELHDDTSQTVTALLFAIEESLEMEDLQEVHGRLKNMLNLAQYTLDGVHKLIFDLRPTMLDHLGLVPALRWFADFRLEPKAVRVNIEEVSQPRRLPSEVETALFRVVQEAINNIARHAAARNVDIRFEFDNDQVIVQVQDDGIGFDVAELDSNPETPRGLGLVSMQERVELLGGDLQVRTNPGRGTQIFLQVPLREKELIYA